MRVRDLRIRLEELIDGAPNGVAAPELSELLKILADLDDMSIEAFFKRLMAKPAKPVPPKVAFDEKAAISRLQKVLSDDDGFHREIIALGAQRGATKPALTRIFHALFDRTRGVPSKATRADLLRLIEDERNIIVRNEKMGQMLGRRVVPAE